MEHRWSIRHNVLTKVAVETRNGIVAGLIRDISLGGMLVETPEVTLPLNAGVVVGFSLRRGGEISHHRLHALVVRSSGRHVGLMYLDADGDDLRALRAALNGSVAPANVSALAEDTRGATVSPGATVMREAV